MAKTRKQLGEKLRAAREEAGLSQEHVAQHLNVPRPAISLIERGQRRVEALELARLAKLFKRPLSYFTDDEAGIESPESPQLQLLRRTTASLSDKDRSEVLRFAEFLRGRSEADNKQ